ncbi:MJ0042 family finger-like domain-containing protein [Nannocystis exedens]|uniref:MJ0042 family finger-like domain-containing protein n=1 Tax=Nannocystis exedens TaxID=54 RepID=A0A1I1T9L3_9BACT|nr:GYF domain-containing protein [Nannocystis exedens]SFD55311.1 MJ0042 family finger-like domain-containing protein [Nannocystis exedens]
MKIECDKCGAKYSIADDKVRGKTFKIRCKKCSNVIIVRDKAGGAEDGGDAPADEPGWHLAIGGETVGPISEAEVRERFAAGEIDKDTSVWQEGFEDWLPLGDVSAFSDLAAAAPSRAAAPDPFAGGSDDDYSAPAPAATPSSSYDRQPEPARQPVAAAPAASASGPKASASPAGGGENPRVSSLTGARNENSVLFSLDSLSSIAMGSKQGGGAAAPSGPSFSLGGGGAPAASPTSNSEGSGLIDIRAMSGMMGGGGGGGGGDEGRDDSMLPSFGGTGFGGLSAAPLLVTPAQPVVEHAPAPEPQRSSNAPLYALMAILLLGMGGMAWYILTRPPPTPETKIVEVIKPVEVKDKAEDEDDGDKPKKKKKEEEEEADETGAAETPPGGTDDKKGTVAKTTTKKTTDKKGEKTDSKSTALDPKVEPKKEEKKEEKKDDYSVDCILDPSKCGKKGGGGGDSGSSKPPADSSLPEKLELSDIQAGVNPVKANAKTNCAKNAKGGEKVSIKLSISGPSGTVLSSTVVDAAGNDGLANCVAAELKKATFKKVQKEQIGTQVSVSF